MVDTVAPPREDGTSSAVEDPPTQSAPPRTPDRPGANKRKPGKELFSALPWLAPALFLMIGIVLFPAGLMIYNSTRNFSQNGKDKGSAGIQNYFDLFGRSELPRVLLNTVAWVVIVVLCTLVISLALANFLNKEFPGRQIVRLAVIVPWASSVIMTTTVFYYSLEPNIGVFNKFLADIGVLEVGDYGFTKNVLSAFIAAIIVGIFVSLPFTTYTILAGLQAIPTDVLEAARVDGASRTRTYFSIILPQLKPAIAVATIINLINVFNSLPILKMMTGSIPGYDADTTTTLIFKMIQSDRDIAGASTLSVINFILVIVIIAIYIKVTNPMQGVDE